MSTLTSEFTTPQYANSTPAPSRGPRFDPEAPDFVPSAALTLGEIITNRIASYSFALQRLEGPVTDFETSIVTMMVRRCEAFLGVVFDISQRRSYWRQTTYIDSTCCVETMA